MDAFLKIPLVILLLVACIQGEKDEEGESDKLINLKFNLHFSMLFGPVNRLGEKNGKGESDSPRTEEPACQCMQEKSCRVAGGAPQGENIFPFAAGLVFGEFNRPFCGGTLITDRHVLTAAHCFDDEKPINELLVNIGDYDLRNKRDGQYFPIQNITMHPEYVPLGLYSDIAIVELKQPVAFNEKIQTVYLPKPGFQLQPGSEVIVFEWGRLETDERYPDKLHAIKLPVLDNRICDRLYQGHDNIICAGGEEGKDFCEGDSGSAVVKELNNQYLQVGVVSFGDEDCGRNIPAAYTKVSSFMDWILDNTKSAGCKPCIYDEKRC